MNIFVNNQISPISKCGNLKFFKAGNYALKKLHKDVKITVQKHNTGVVCQSGEDNVESSTLSSHNTREINDYIVYYGSEGNKFSDAKKVQNNNQGKSDLLQNQELSSSSYFVSQNLNVSGSKISKDLIDSPIDEEKSSSLDVTFEDKTPQMPLNQYEFTLDGPPRFVSPTSGGCSAGKLLELPLMLYLPGIDGTGFSATTQFPDLAAHFDVKCFSIPPNDRTSFADLFAIVKEYLMLESQNTPVTRPIYLFGESLGALLAMAVAAECSDIVDRVILVNPPNRQLQTALSSLAPLVGLLPNDVYSSAPFFMLPALVIPAAVANSSSPFKFLQQLLQEVDDRLPQAMSLPDLLPADTLQWKLKCLQDGLQLINKLGYKNIKQRTLILTSNLDLRTPSGTEGEQLERILPYAKKVKLEEVGLAFLQDKSVSLSSIIKENNFYISTRRMSSFPKEGGRKIRRGNKYAQAGPIEIPNLREVDEDFERVFLNLAHRAVSPCFFSTDNNHRVWQGLEHVPRGEQILLIGNHQPLPLDFSFIVAKFLRERGTLIRSLTHPIIFRQFQNRGTTDSTIKTMIKYGVVPVSPTNMYKLMHLGESVMMLPGGAAEATKSLRLKHKLIWPESAEFVRMAAKFNVTIVPFSSVVGTTIPQQFVELLSSEDIMQIPVIGNMLKQASQSGTLLSKDFNPRAWQGKSASNPTLLPPLSLILPTLPARYYIKFGRPVKTDSSWVKDREMCSQIYSEIKNEVQGGMDYLLLKRKEDPYQEFVPRLSYEASRNFKQQAPTFPL